MEEPLISLHPKSCQEKLLWEKERVKKLTEENNKLLSQINNLSSHIEDLKQQMKFTQVGALILKTQKQKQTIADLENRNKDLKSNNEQLIVKLGRLQANR